MFLIVCGITKLRLIIRTKKDTVISIEFKCVCYIFNLYIAMVMTTDKYIFKHV